MVEIAKVEWIDESQQEADVTISDGMYSIVCFSCPFIFQEKDSFSDKVYCLDVENIQKVFETEPLVNKKEDYYEYLLRGRLVNKEEGTVYIGGIQVDISEAHIPGDISNGDMIEFSVSRLDIY